MRISEAQQPYIQVPDRLTGRQIEIAGIPIKEDITKHLTHLHQSLWYVARVQKLEKQQPQLG